MHLFPASGFDQSAITPVFLGVIVSWIMTETFGWPFVGLVVPGYLATLFLLDPRSATIDVFEAIVTYAFARLLCEHLSRTGLTTRMFGRERFLAVLLVSILVRLLVEGALLPWLVPHAKWAYSIGLVVVPLAANACWKTGLLRGTYQNAVITLIVYACLRWGLIPHTNLSLAGFHLSIESVATSFLHSPDAYLVLMTGALLAAIANVRYGWDYGGILLPALVALAVPSPIKFAATFIEAAVLVGVVALLIRFTPVGRWNIEGPRRPVLFLSTDYGLRFLAAFALGRSLPGSEIVELTGLGYLLPSLLAVKASQKRSLALVFLPTVTISVMAFGLSTAVAKTSALLSPPALLSSDPVKRHVGVMPKQAMPAALWLAALARPSGERTGPKTRERATTLARAVLSVARGDAEVDAGLVVQRLHANVIGIRERFAELDGRQGYPAVLISTVQSRGPRRVALVPAPLSAPHVAAQSGRWLEQGLVSAIVIAGSEEESSPAEAGSDEAHQLARSLANAGPWPGLVIALRGAAECSVHVARRTSGNAASEPLIEEINLPSCTRAERAANPSEDVSIQLPEAMVDGWLPAVEAGPSVGTGSALALELRGLHLVRAEPSVEELLVLRRLVLEPLLAPSPSHVSIRISRVAAETLGYRLLGPTTLPGGHEGLLLLPQAEGAPMALVAKRGGASGAVIEVPHAGSAALRALALRLSSPLSADAVLLGLERGAGALGNDAFAEAHAVAAWPRRGRSPAIVVLRQGGAGSSIGLATWGGANAARLGSETDRGLEMLGLSTQPEAMDLATGEQAARSVFGDTPLAALTVPASLLDSPALALDPTLLPQLTDLPTRDSDSRTALLSMIATVTSSDADSPTSALDAAKSFASDGSISALRSLQTAIASTSTRATIVRTDSIVDLAVIGRRHGSFDLAVFPLLFADSAAREEERRAPTVDACVSLIVNGGTCRVEPRP